VATIYGFLALFMWGVLAALSVFTQAVPPFQLLAFCFTVAAGILFVKRVIYRERVFKLANMSRQQWLVGVGGLFGFHLCYFLALRYAPPIESSLIIYLWPLLLGIMVAKSGTKHYAVLGGLLGFLGSVLIISQGVQLQPSSEQIFGYVLALCCALIWAGYSWYFSTTNNSVEDIGWLSLAVAGISLICHLIFEQTYWPETGFEYFMLVLIGLGPTGGAFYLWDYGMKNGNPSVLASLSFSTPVISSVALYLFGFAELSLAILIAIMLVVTGAVISNKKAVE
jgi:drug/metabolite transporter (DMT)-like permease